MTRPSILIGSAFLILAALATASAQGQSGAVRDAADFSRPDSPTCGIQEAIDSL